MADIEVRSEIDEEGMERWERVTDEPDVLGVEAFSIEEGEPAWSWEVSVHAAEFVREDPLESEFRDRIGDALRSVAGVTDVAEEDREVWILAGRPAGKDLVLAASRVLDELSARIRRECFGED